MLKHSASTTSVRHKMGKKDEKEFMKISDFEELKNANESAEITYVKWCDNKVVHLVSTLLKHIL